MSRDLEAPRRNLTHSRIAGAAMLVGVFSCPAAAQTPISGHVSFTFDHFPSLNVSGLKPSTTTDGSASVTEVRARLFGDASFRRGALTLRAAGYAEGLAADRHLDQAATHAIIRAQELYAELTANRADLRIGFSRIVWGRLDELQPGDVVNPLDLSKFFFEGRSEARLPILAIRGRWHVREGGTLEGVLVPEFQRGYFDQLGEDTSPFRVVPRGVPTRVEEPEVSWSNLQGGLRVAATTGRVDWAIAAFRGFEAFPIYRAELVAQNFSSALVASHPRTSMLAGDFESVLGEWGIRGELVAVLEDTLQVRDLTRSVEGRSLQAGVGVDRRSGDSRYSVSTFVDRLRDRTAVTLIASAERAFSRETRRVRGLGLYNVSEGTFFLRAIGAISVRDNLWLEASAGLFAGEGDDIVGLFRDRDFLYARVKYYF